jgi:Flp pilus assembly pilin Flp
MKILASFARDQKGAVLVVCLAILVMISLIGIASITTSNTEMQIADNSTKSTGAFYAAESGLERAAANIAHSYRTLGTPPSPLPSDTLSELRYVYGYYTSDDGAAAVKQLEQGSYKGLYGLVKSFTINSLGVDSSSRAGVELKMQMEDALIPIFQFAVFYEYDLEIAPGPSMTLGGRVHTNHDMYLQCDNSLYIDSYLSAAGSIFHGRKSGSGMSTTTKDVFIKDASNVYKNMKNTDGTFLDSRASDWVNSSLSRWGGRVEDGNHGITPLYMPVVADGPATDLIDRGAGNADSYENKAGLKFVDGQAYFKEASGTWTNVTSALTGAGIISTGTFNDGREGKNASTIDIDIAKLNTSGYFPTNGIIYASKNVSGTSVSAIRLKNGQELRSALTVATNNPLYTLGNYNTVNKKSASLIADGFTVLSNNWNDGKSTYPSDSRLATPTQVNACYLTGNQQTGTDGRAYNGGFENLPRFLENWDNITFTWRGSAVDLWYSRQTTGNWGGSYYTPPKRDWAFDNDLLDINKLPPGTPMINVVQRKNWAQKINNSVSLSTN